MNIQVSANLGAEEKIPGVNGDVPSGGVGHSAAATTVVLLGAGVVAADTQHASPADEVAPRHWEILSRIKLKFWWSRFTQTYVSINCPYFSLLPSKGFRICLSKIARVARR